MAMVAVSSRRSCGLSERASTLALGRRCLLVRVMAHVDPNSFLTAAATTDGLSKHAQGLHNVGFHLIRKFRFGHSSVKARKEGIACMAKHLINLEALGRLRDPRSRHTSGTYQGVTIDRPDVKAEGGRAQAVFCALPLINMLMLIKLSMPVL